MKPHLSISEYENLLQSQNVRCVKHDDVDIELWDQCIMNSINGNVYVSSWYLDIVCDNWEALILGDYDYVMPLFPKRKMGLLYNKEPYLIPRSGVYSSSLISESITTKFIESIPNRYLYSKFSFHEMQILSESEPLKKKLYKLDLIESYAQIRSRFSLELESNLVETKKARHFVLPLSNTNDFISFAESLSHDKSFSLSRRRSNQLRRIVNFALRFELGQIFSVYSGQNELCGVLFVIWYDKTATCVTALFSSSGIQKGAHYILFDHFLKKNAGINKTFEVFLSNLNSSFFDSLYCNRIGLTGFNRNCISRFFSRESKLE